MDVDKTTQNDEIVTDQTLSDNDTSHEDDSNVEAADDTSTESEDTITLTRDELAEREKTARKEQDKRWKERIEKGGITLKEEASKEDSSKDNKLTLGEIAYFKGEGITDKEAMAEVVRLANKFGMSLDEAVDDSDVMDRAKGIARKNENNQKIAPTKGGATRQTQDEVYWARQLQEKGKSAPTAEMRRKVREYLAGKS